jgi:hypothetical protein
MPDMHEDPADGGSVREAVHNDPNWRTLRRVVNTRTRTSALLALLVAVTVTAVACTPGVDDGNEEAPSSSVTKTEPDTLDWLLVATEDDSNMGMAAEAIGAVVIDTGAECVLLDPDAESIPTTPIVFPHGSVLLDGATPRIIPALGDELEDGSTVSIVGGWVPEENIALIDTIKHIAISEECWNLADSREVLLVNPTSAIVGAPGP